VPLLVIAALVKHEPHRIWTMVVGAAGALAFMLIVYVASRGGMGDGDVRLAPLLGAYLGWLNPGMVAMGFFLAFLFGAVVGVAVMIASHGGRKTAVPFGPFLAAGTIAAIWLGQPMIDALLGR
jgi:leader peptidase (prepilin peptidase)/N-methyltransferase